MPGSMPPESCLGDYSYDPDQLNYPMFTLIFILYAIVYVNVSLLHSVLVTEVRKELNWKLEVI